MVMNIVSNIIKPIVRNLVSTSINSFEEGGGESPNPPEEEGIVFLSRDSLEIESRSDELIEAREI
jgi:hypothetical protein